jgi:Flp pilus assembly protein TadB
MEPKVKSDHSTVDLVRRASEQFSTLVRDEFQLARTEMTQKGKQAGKGAGLFGAAAMLAFYGVAALLTGVVLAVALALPAWAAAFIVGVVLIAIAGILAMMGRNNVRRVGPAVPQATIDSLRADVNAVSHAVEERGRP